MNIFGEKDCFVLIVDSVQLTSKLEWIGQNLPWISDRMANNTKEQTRNTKKLLIFVKKRPKYQLNYQKYSPIWAPGKKPSGIQKNVP